MSEHYDGDDAREPLGEEPGGLDLEELKRVIRERRPRGPSRAVRLARTGGFLLVAAALIGTPWYLAARGPTTPAPAPTRSPSPTASSTPSPTPTATPTTVWTVKPVDNCLRIRVAPGLGNALLDCVQTGTELRHDGQFEEADGFVWMRVYSPFKKEWGWAAGQYLAPR